MRKEVGASAGFVALLAVVIHSVFRPETSGPPVAMPPEGASSDKELRLSVPWEAPGVIEGPWLATREFFHTPEKRIWPCKPERRKPDEPESDLLFPFCEIDSRRFPNLTQATRAMFGINECAGPIRVIIATVPDPVRSRLALTADEQIETVEYALQAAGWEFAEQWLPWSDVPDPNQGNVSKRRYERYLLRLQQELPGVLVFRKAAAKARRGAEIEKKGCISSPEPQRERVFSRESLLVFVVGETPTAGINGRAFQAARKLASAFIGPSDHLGILAPTFSGSFYSLASLLAPEDESFKSRIHVYSGSASRKEYGELFTYHTGITFHSGGHNSADFQKGFCEVLDRYHIDHSDAASLVEDETAYGDAITADRKDCSDVRMYRFPRDISHLRNAYREAVNESQRSIYNPLPGLDFSMRDPRTGEDSIPVYSLQQTPQAQNAVLAEITTDFNRRRVRLVNISASNILDLLFLAHMIRVESPDTRVLISDAHALFIPAAANASLEGTLFLSSYPMTLSMSGVRQIPPPAKDQGVVFAHAGHEGLFNVTQFLLRDMGLENSPRLDYGHAHDSEVHREDHPPLWLLTANGYGFFPLQAIRLDHKLHQKWMPADPDRNWRDPAREMHFPRPPRSWMLLEGCLAIAIVVFCLLLMEANTNPVSHLPMGLKIRPGFYYFAGRCLSLASLLFVLSASQWILVLPVAIEFFKIKYEEADLLVIQTFIVIGVVGFFAPLLAIWYVMPAWRLRAQLLKRGHRWHTAAFAALVAWYGCALWFWWCCTSLDRDKPDAAYFDMRALEIYSGSSPAVPILVLLGALFVIAVAHFRRYSLAALDQPYLPLGPARRPDIEAHLQKVSRQVVSPIDLTTRQACIITGLVVGFGVSSWFLLRCYAYFSAFEQRPYNYLLVSSELAAFALLALGCVHIVRLWRAFEQLLVDFESFVYMGPLVRVTRSWPRRPIWSSGKFIRNPAFERQSLIALHNRKVVNAARPAAEFDSFHDAVKAMRETRALRPAFEGVFETTRKYYDCCRDIAQEILSADLYPYWLSHVVGERPAETTINQSTEASISIPAGADFVVLQLARYFVFVAVQIQRLAWALSLLMVILMVAFNTYRVQAPQTVGRLMAVCFVVIGFFVVPVFAGLERNPILSRIAGTRPGKLNWEFYGQIAALGALPLIGVLAHLFPAVGGFLSSWVAPSVESVH